MSDVLELRYQLSEAYAKLAHTERALEQAQKDLLVLRAQAAALRPALKDFYHECECCHDAIHAVNRRAYTALQMTENLP